MSVPAQLHVHRPRVQYQSLRANATSASKLLISAPSSGRLLRAASMDDLQERRARRCVTDCQLDDDTDCSAQLERLISTITIDRRYRGDETRAPHYSPFEQPFDKTIETTCALDCGIESRRLCFDGDTFSYLNDDCATTTSGSSAEKEAWPATEALELEHQETQQSGVNIWDRRKPTLSSDTVLWLNSDSVVTDDSNFELCTPAFGKTSSLKSVYDDTDSTPLGRDCGKRGVGEGVGLSDESRCISPKTSAVTEAVWERERAERIHVISSSAIPDLR